MLALFRTNPGNSMPFRALPAFALCLFLAACGPGEEIYQQHAEAMDSIAEQYVRLALAMGEHDASYVDAYFGPGHWRTEAEELGLGLEEIAEEDREYPRKRKDGNHENKPKCHVCNMFCSIRVRFFVVCNRVYG